MNGQKHSKLLKVEDVAEALNVPRSWVYKKTEQGELPCIRVGRYLRFDLNQVMASFGSER